MIIRPSRGLDDFVAVAAVYAASYAHFCPAFYPDDTLQNALPIISEPQQKLLEDPGFRVVEDDTGNIVAAGGWTANIPGTDEFKSRCHVRHLACHPDFSGKGFGRRLLTALMADAANQGYKEMDAYATLNSAAFYQKLGFEKLQSKVVSLRPANVQFETVWMRAQLDKPSCST